LKHCTKSFWKTNWLNKTETSVQSCGKSVVFHITVKSLSLHRHSCADMVSAEVQRLCRLWKVYELKTSTPRRSRKRPWSRKITERPGKRAAGILLCKNVYMAWISK